MDYQEVNIEKIGKVFKRFAKIECKEISPLYYELSKRISEDNELLKLSSFCRWRQPIPNLFFASVHYLLLNSPNEELASFYPSIRKNHQSNLPFELFKDFCMRNKEQIKEIEGTKIVQTNAFNRCAYLMPILSHHFSDQEINIIDIGTSAGLTLNMDKYEYYYDGKYFMGDSQVKIRSEIREGKIPNVQGIIKINKKIGIDQNPLDLKISENSNWLKALIWADKTDRIRNIEAAIEVAQDENIQFEKKATVEEFEKVINDQEIEIPLVVYHTNALYQFTKQERKEFREMIERIGRKRDLIYLAAEGSAVFDESDDYIGVLIEKTEYKNQKKYSQILALTNGHANWIKWN